MREKACNIDDAIDFNGHVQQVKYPVSFANSFLDQAKAARLGLCLQLGKRPEAALFVLF
jgi:hypothetical protein